MPTQEQIYTVDERERLVIQNRLLAEFEIPALKSICGDRHGLSVLDIGCNDGTKTVGRFASPAFQRVICLEYGSALAELARNTYANEKFSFFALDAECEDFSERLTDIIADCQLDGFDVICLSFVLMHLRNPERLLRRLCRFLRPNGCLFIVEANDRNSRLSGDTENRLSSFFDILEKDPCAGNRNVGPQLENLLSRSGYGQIISYCEQLGAVGEQPQRRCDIYETFFSYLPSDIRLLINEEPNNRRYREWEAWVRTEYPYLRSLIVDSDEEIYMGVRILSCKPNDDCGLTEQNNLKEMS